MSKIQDYYKNRNKLIITSTVFGISVFIITKMIGDAILFGIVDKTMYALTMFLCGLNYSIFSIKMRD